MFIEIIDGLNVTEFLGIQKWEKPIPAELRGLMKGDFPSFIPKTSEERIQNLTKQIPKFVGKSFSIEEKLHGTSMSVYIKDNEFGVCSRNVELKESETNSYWKTAHNQDLLGILNKMFEVTKHEYALQGELIGEGINGNMYNIKGHRFCLFNIFDITEQRYLEPVVRENVWMNFCKDYSDYHCPILNRLFVFREQHTIDHVLKMVEHKSVLNNKVWAEGWVFKCNEDPSIHFKAVSNKFLCSSEGEDA